MATKLGADRPAEDGDLHRRAAQDRAPARSCAACSATSPRAASLGDTTTLADPGVVEEIKRRAAEAPTEDWSRAAGEATRAQCRFLDAEGSGCAVDSAN